MTTLSEELRHIPFIRLIIPFICGIVFQTYFSIPIKQLLIGIFFVYAIICSINLTKLGQNYSLRWLFGVTVHLFLFLVGIQLVNIHQAKLNNCDYNKGTILANIIEEPEEKEKTFKAVVTLEALEDTVGIKNATGKVILYLQKDSASKALAVGDQILFQSWVLREIENANNPNEFDYKRYLANQSINSQAYLKSDSWQLIKSKQKQGLMVYASQLRKKLLGIYQQTGITGQEFSVLSALTLGYKTALDKETRQSYASSGAMHILAVSGLHVGIIFFILKSLFFFLDRNRYSRVLKAFIIITLLWIYAFITGLSPSVMRAATMFSFIVFGKALDRQSSIYNTLAVSAFILLLINPYMIMEVGFQLSYLAVIGIVFFYPRFYAWLGFDNWFLDKAWSLICVSLAAQLATAPIGLFYFHQFPNYFLLTNLIVIPFATIILYLAMLLFAFSFWEVAANLVAFVLKYTLKGLNISVEFIEQLPYSITSSVSINTRQVLIIYLIIITLTLFFIYQRSRWLKISLLSMVCLFGLSAFQKYETINKRKFIVYNINGISAYDFIDGDKGVLISSASEKDYDKVMYAIKNNWDVAGIQNEDIVNLNDSNIIYQSANLLCGECGVMQFYDTRFLLLRNKIEITSAPKQLELDCLILSNNVNYSIEELMKSFRVKRIIIDSSNSFYKRKKWKEECNRLNIKSFAVSEQGAFQLEV